MRYLILSDIHANKEALAAALDAAPEHDVVWNLGDLVGYGASPNEVIDTCAALGRVFVRGNHDRVCSGERSAEDFNPMAQRAVRWTHHELSAGHTEWLKTIPKGPVHPDGPNVACVHGSPLDEDQYISTVRDAWLPLMRAERRIVFFGHTHIQGAFARHDTKWLDLKPRYRTNAQAEKYELPLDEDTRYLINPGSIGQPRDGDWRAAFALYDDAAMSVTFCRVPYNIRDAQKRILDAGLPPRLAHRLTQGR